jgi:hypothetical protein
MSLPAPFIYRLGPHRRQHDPQGYLDYGSYKEWLRDEFEFKCVYCLEREMWARSRKAEFSVEHIKPKRTHPELECVYTNLLYACIRCNLAKRMGLLLDPCSEGLGKHVEFDDDMQLRALTPEGRVFIESLHLNEDPAWHIRKRYRTILKLYERVPDDPETKALFDDAFRYPEDLPDLSRCEPATNPLHGGIANSHFERHRRGELSTHY